MEEGVGLNYFVSEQFTLNINNKVYMKAMQLSFCHSLTSFILYYIYDS